MIAAASMDVHAKTPKDLSKDWMDLQASYSAMSESQFVRRRTGLAPGGAGAMYHVRNERAFLELIESSRDMSRNDNIIGKTIEKAATNCVQEGFILKPDTGDAGADKELSARWKEWSEDADQCDIQGESTWHEMEILAVTSNIRDGDIFGIGTEEDALQMIEGHLCRNPYGFKRDKLNTVLGVELDEFQRAIRYHIRQEPINPHRLPHNSTSKPYDARDTEGHRQVFHFHVKDRVSSTRGVTALAPIFQIAGMFEDTLFARVVQQQILSCIAFFRYQDASTHGLPSIGSPQNYGAEETERGPTADRLIDEMKPGMEAKLPKGEKIEAFSPNVPNPEFFPFIKVLLQMIGINIGVPYVEMMMDGEATNFSGWRGAVDTARRNWKRTQRSLRERWHEPVYRWKVRQWIADDSGLRSIQDREGVNLLRHKWTLPSWPYIQPVEDAAANLVRLSNGLAAPSEIQEESGKVYVDHVNTTIADNSLAIREAKKEAAAINKDFPDDPDPVTWQRLYPMPTPQGIQISLNANVQPDRVTPSKDSTGDNDDQS